MGSVSDQRDPNPPILPSPGSEAMPTVGLKLGVQPSTSSAPGSWGTILMRLTGLGLRVTVKVRVVLRLHLGIRSQLMKVKLL